MPEANKLRQLHRHVIERIVITGTLRLETPAHFGNGDADAFTDMPLLRDELDGSPLLPGTSIAGALRNYLRERQLGDYADALALPTKPKDRSAAEKERHKEERENYLDNQGRAAILLFGGSRGDEDGSQSPLIVHDALGVATGYELRDGVRIEPETRTAKDEEKYDITLLTAGSTFDLRFDLLVCQPEERGDHALAAHREALLEALVTALDGLTRGEITLGARKRRGFGRCRVDEWAVQRYDLRTRAGLLAWLAEGRDGWAETVMPTRAASLAVALGEEIAPLPDARQRVKLSASFAIDGSLLVRSGAVDSGPDMAHLHSPRPRTNGEMTLRPILAGTSWAGALRSRATQIAYTLAPQERKARRDNKVTELIDRIFGPAEIESRKNKDRDAESDETSTDVEKEPKASRIEIAETVIAEQGIRKLEQTRIKIDRFTGGAFESALFAEQPLFGKRDTRGKLLSELKLELSLRLPVALSPDKQSAEIGLLLLLLKDLWTGDLPLGGEAGIGRGRLQGKAAALEYDGRRWELTQADNGSIAVAQGDRAALQDFVTMLGEELR